MTRRSLTTRERVAGLRFPIRGRRVLLEPTTSKRVVELVRLLNEPSVSRWTLHMPYPYREEHAREWVRRTARNRRAGTSLGLSVVRRSDGRLLGGVGIHHIEEGGGRGEVGYWIGSEHRGRGYASEAVDLLVRTAFRRLGLHRIEARVFPGNRASQRVARRAGFRYECRLRDEVKKGGRWRATLLFSRLPSDRRPGPRRRVYARRRR